MQFIGVLGILVLMGISYLFSKNKKAINWRTIGWGLGLQILFALSILGTATISFSATAVLLVLVLVYLIWNRFLPYFHSDAYPIKSLQNMNPTVVIALCLVKFGVLPIFLGYYFGKTNESTVAMIINIIWMSVVAVWILRKFVKNMFQLPLNSGLVSIAMSLSLGLSVAIVEISSGARGSISANVQLLSEAVGTFLSVPTNAGASLIFGSLAQIKEPWYFLFFVQVLPTIIFFSAFISVLYYLGVIQVLIQEISKFMTWTMQTSGAETLSCSGNIFVGQTEAPILIKPYLGDMTNSEIHAVMTGGFATIAGGVFAGFVAMGIDASYLISASVMSAPAALMLSKMFYPEQEESRTKGDVEIPDVKISDNVIGAAAQGTGDGLQLALNVGATLLAFIALIKVVDMGLGTINPNLNLNVIFGYVFQYVALLLGVSPEDMKQVGALLGNKITINEFVAYGNLAEMIKAGTLSPRSQAIATYALCGFANFSSIGIQIGGIAPMAPHRRADIASMGFSAMWAGAFASWMTAAIAGMFIS